MSVATLEKLLKIGEVAEISQLPIKTIRYYEELGLLTPSVSRSESNYRLFQPSVLHRLAFIRRSQSLGLSLREIQDILRVHDGGQLPCGEVKQNLQRKVQQVNEQITSLEILRGELVRLLTGWQEFSGSQVPEQIICPNLDGLPNALLSPLHWQPGFKKEPFLPYSQNFQRHD